LDDAGEKPTPTAVHDADDALGTDDPEEGAVGSEHREHLGVVPLRRGATRLGWGAPDESVGRHPGALPGRKDAGSVNLVRHYPPPTCDGPSGGIDIGIGGVATDVAGERCREDEPWPTVRAGDTTICTAAEQAACVELDEGGKRGRQRQPVDDHAPSERTATT
jgi:hypothetical protein